MSFQTIIIAAHLGRDPEMRYTPAGQAVTNFNLAANRQYTDSSGQVVKETTWFRVSACGKMAEACNTHLKKCAQVFVEGRLIADPATGGPRIWNRQDGAPAASFELHASLIRFLGGKNGSGNGSPADAAAGSDEQNPF